MGKRYKEIPRQKRYTDDKEARANTFNIICHQGISHYSNEMTLHIYMNCEYLKSSV